MEFTLERVLEIGKNILENNFTQIILGGVVIFTLTIILQKSVRSIFQRSKIVNGKEQATLISMTNSIIKYVATIAFLFFALGLFGIEVGSMLAGAGVLGIVIGFGAQSLIQDLLAGIFLIYEKQLKQGDWVNANGTHEGTVEEIGFRVIKIRQWSGTLVTINNGQVRTIENFNMNKMRVVESITVSFHEDPNKVFSVLEQACVKLNSELGDYLKKDLSGEPIEPFVVFGITSLNNQFQGYQYTITGLCEDLVFFPASRQARRIIAQLLFDNKIKMAEQLVEMHTEPREKQ